MKIEKLYLIGIHRYSFRQGEMAEIIGARWVTPTPRSPEPRPCYEVVFADGVIDFVPIFIQEPITDAWTIPNPDIVVGSFATISALVGKAPTR